MFERAFFVTGTDTGIGKTTVSSAIAAGLAARGLRVGVAKPLETGCEPLPDGALFAADAARLKFFSGCAADPDAICPFRFREPLAPAVAARRSDRTIDLARIAEAIGDLARSHDVTIVEGAGGLLVPVAPGVTFAELAREWRLPVLIVVGNRLGALNHAQLTVRAVQEMDLAYLGYVVSSLAPVEDVAALTNREVLAEIIGPSLGVLPWLGEIRESPADRARLAAAAEASLALDAFNPRTGPAFAPRPAPPRRPS